MAVGARSSHATRNRAGTTIDEMPQGAGDYGGAGDTGGTPTGGAGAGAGAGDEGTTMRMLKNKRSNPDTRATIASRARLRFDHGTRLTADAAAEVSCS